MVVEEGTLKMEIEGDAETDEHRTTVPMVLPQMGYTFQRP